ncbi:BSD domain-containing protein 1-like isoform X2 [Leguminivora glycinivorella]|uniref:BSD domain-containing protein 1-like isoform X2 n=1 Tax=Leguminivora glycinivorella TaxID=1035111 RepID=UPI00200F0AE8|nr:BSD domain-containing protein 1-like isoform X2 [Leguminivora glycinivorella]
MMAEKSPDVQASEPSTPQVEQPSGNWWDSWISSAKTKSAEVYSMVKKDLDEIGSAVKSEASHVFSTTSTALGKTLKLDEPESPANVMKKSLSTFIGQVSTVLNPEPDDEDDTEVILSSGDTTMLSTYKKELEALQRVDATYLVPASSPELDAWRASLESGAELISPASAAKRLSASPLLRAMYDKLVPDAVSHEDFWERYLFRVALLQDRLAADARRLPAADTDPVLAHLPRQHAEPIQQSPKKVLSGVETEVEEEPSEQSEPTELTEPLVLADTVAWEDEDFANDVELTEEQQTLLLEEYEKEISSKKTKQTSSRDLANNNIKNKNTGNNKQRNQNGGKKNVKKGKSDVCGNDLVEDYFAEKEVKDDASANSDESWEKFDIDEEKA